MASRLIFKPVTKATWKDFEALFESKGGPSYCWCMPFRELESRKQAGNADRKKAIKARVDKRTPIGLVGYLKGDPVAWVSIGPRDSFVAKLTEDFDPEADKDVWSITCLFIRRDMREEGLSDAMLAAAVGYAHKRGAKIVEGYPVAKTSPSYRFMGFVPLFEKAGFKAAGKAGSRRHVMRKPFP